jgi:2'-5' RNA ligase
MRLFIAINFDGATKQKLLAVQDRLRLRAPTANYTRPENLHLTLLFIGETENVAALRRMIATCFTEPFDIVFDRAGTFGRGLYWVGVRETPELDALAASLAADAGDAGLPFDAKERFTPHITIAREAVPAARPELSFEPFSMRVGRVSLMKSERVRGVLTYTEVYGKSAERA